MFSKKEYVYAVYTEKSFTKAANKLYISQPCLSAAIKKVEEEIGMPLFERRYSDIRLTEAGNHYIETAERIMALEAEFENRVHNIANLEYGSIVLGGSNYVCSHILPKIVGAFTKRYPKIETDIVETSSVELEKKLLDESVDVIIDSFDSENDRFEYLPLVRETILLAVPMGSFSNNGLEKYSVLPSDIYEGKACLDELREIPVDRFKEEKFILLKNGNSMYRHARSAFESCDFTPEVIFRLDQLLTSFSLADAGNGACFVTDTLFRYHRFNDNVRLYRIKNSGERMLYTAKKKNKYISSAIKAFDGVASETIK